MKIRQLELYSGVSNAYLSQIENGKRGVPSPEIIKKLSKALGSDYEELMLVAGHIEEKQKTNEGDGVSENKKMSFFYELERDLNIDLSDPQVQKALKRAAKIVFTDED